MTKHGVIVHSPYTTASKCLIRRQSIPSPRDLPSNRTRCMLVPRTTGSERDTRMTETQEVAAVKSVSSGVYRAVALL